METITYKLKEDEFYNFELDPTKDIYFIIGGRGVGKSYSIKHHIKKEIEKGNKFMYVRGKKAELATAITWLEETNLQNSFGFEGSFKRGKPFANALSFTPIQADEVACSHHIGYTVSLEDSALIKSGVFNDVTTIVFEEYVRHNQSYKQEVQHAINFFELVETVARERNIKVFCLSNNVRAISPLEEIFADAKNAIKIKIFKKVDKKGVLSNVQNKFIEYLQGEQLIDEYVNLNEFIAFYSFKYLDQNVVLYRHIFDSKMIAFNIEQTQIKCNKYDLLKNTFKMEDKQVFFSNFKTEKFVRKNFSDIISLIKKEVYG